MMVQSTGLDKNMSPLDIGQLPEFYQGLSNASILIVGNGPSAAGRELGEQIDSFDSIVRINNYVTDKMESSVGSRTDLWVNGANQGLKKRSQLPPNILVMIPPEVLRYKGDAIYDRIKKRLRTSDYTMLPLPTMEAMEQSCGLTRPTTGFFAIYFFHQLGLDVTIHGFDFFVGSKGHYFDNPLSRWLKDKGIIKKAAKHDIAGEKAFIEGLIKAGEIKRLVS